MSYYFMILISNLFTQEVLIHIIYSTIDTLLILISAAILLNIPYLGSFVIPTIKQTFEEKILKQKAETAVLPKEIEETIKRYGDYIVYVTPSKQVFGLVKQVGKQIFYLSSGAIQKLSTNVLRYIVVHEIGHTKLGHIKARISLFRYIELLTFIFVFFLNPSILLMFLFSCLLTLSLFFYFRHDEDEADLFACKELGIDVLKEVANWQNKRDSFSKILDLFMYHRHGNKKIEYLQAKLKNDARSVALNDEIKP